MCIAYTGKNNLLNYNSLSVCCGWEEYSLERKEKKNVWGLLWGSRVPLGLYCWSLQKPD